MVEKKIHVDKQNAYSLSLYTFFPLLFLCQLLMHVAHTMVYHNLFSSFFQSYNELATDKNIYLGIFPVLY